MLDAAVFFLSFIFFFSDAVFFFLVVFVASDCLCPLLLCGGNLFIGTIGVVVLFGKRGFCIEDKLLGGAIVEGGGTGEVTTCVVPRDIRPFAVVLAFCMVAAFVDVIGIGALVEIPLGLFELFAGGKRCCI